MRIAFDLDDTLIPAMHKFPIELPPRRLLGRLLAHVPLRAGTTGLMKELTAGGHELWIYTSSLRGRFHIRQLFNIRGIRLDGIVNADIHANRLRGMSIQPSKYPPAFGIDVLIDDSEGVKQEAIRYGFRVIRIVPSDIHWVEVVHAGLRPPSANAA